MADDDLDDGAPREDADDTELAELRRLAARVRPGDVTWELPPVGLWDRIEAETEPVAPVHVASERRPRWIATAAAAAAAAIVVVGALVLLGGDGDSEVVASVPLEQLEGSGSGRAELVSGDGGYQLHVETADLADDDGYLELWLIDPTVTKMVSLGPLRPDGVYDLPAGVDPTAFPIVDISSEPVDGDPAHSGRSLLRGTLPL